jgi:hypothetical protein
MTTSVREKLNDGKFGIIVGVVMVALAGLAIYYYTRPAFPHVDATQLYYSDDDGASYYKDSVYKFPPYDHNGKTAYQVTVLSDNGHKFVGYLIRYTPDAHKQLEDKYNDAINSHLPDRELQQKVLDFMHGPQIGWQMEVKLPGPDNKWLPRSALGTLNIKTPSGQLPDSIVYP